MGAPFKLAAHASHRAEDGGFLLYDARGDLLYRGNEAGLLVLWGCERGLSSREIAAAISDRWDVTRARAIVDVQRLGLRLRELNLVE